MLLQLRQDVVDADQVLLLVLQLGLGRGLSALELHDSGGLVEELPALLRLAAQDFVDLALADDGVAFLADACVVEQLVHVLQSAGAAVDQIFTFSGTVDAPGHRHLVEAGGQLMVRIVQRDGHIGVA